MSAQPMQDREAWLADVLAKHGKWVRGEDDGKRANLYGANLSDANLYGANLRHADLTGANLSGVSVVIDLGVPNGWRMVAWLRDGVLMFRVGCRDKTLAEVRAYWNETHENWPERQEVALMIDVAVKTAKLRGWEFSE